MRAQNLCQKICLHRIASYRDNCYLFILRHRHHVVVADMNVLSVMEIFRRAPVCQLDTPIFALLDHCWYFSELVISPVRFNHEIIFVASDRAMYSVFVKLSLTHFCNVSIVMITASTYYIIEPLLFRWFLSASSPQQESTSADTWVPSPDPKYISLLEAPRK